jgi:hypothetical protein
MKKIQKYMMIALAGVLVVLTAGCEKDPSAGDDFSKDYDIPWIVSRITNVSPIEAAPGANITLTGENLGTNFVQSDGFSIGAFPCTIVSQNTTSVTITVPMGVIEPSDISVYNLHNRTFVYKEQFIPKL